MKRVQHAWLRQSRTEYTAAALVAEMTHWLVVLGVNPDLLVRSSRVVSDEIRHAVICRELYLHAGGSPEPVALSPQQLIHGDDRGASMQHRAITAAGELACEESVALGVFRMRLENARDPMAQEVCTVILRDEATHRAFAWDLLDELIRMQGVEEVRAWARPRLAWWLRIYLGATLRPNEPTYPPEELAYGLIDRRQHWTAMLRTVEEDVIPRFRECGILEEGVDAMALKAEMEAKPGRPG